jgi:integrase
LAIYRRGRIWWIDYYFRGKRIREPVSESRQEAVVALKARKGDIVRGKFELKKEAGERLFEDFAIDFTEHIRTTRKWWKTEMSRMKQLVKHFGDLYLSEITPYHVDCYKANRRKAVSGACVNRELGLLKCMLNKAIKWGFLRAENPVRGIPYYPETPKERILTDEEAQALVAHCCESVRAVVVAALLTGMRRGELLDLKWENVDFRNRFIRVVRSKNNRMRKVPMNSVLYEELKKLRRNGSEYVFTQMDSNKPLSCVRSAFERACKASGIRGLRFHDLRHTFATNLVLSGIDLVTVKEILGHSDIAMTVRYSHPSDTRKMEAVESLVLEKAVVDKNGYGMGSHNLVTIPENDQKEGFVTH